MVLNSDWQPHRIVSWKDAFVLIYSKDNGAYLVATYDKTVSDSMGRQYNLPAVIVLSKYISTNNNKAPFSKRSIYLRDNFTCQYCGGRFATDKLNIDHVYPRSRPDKLPKGMKLNSFENCVTSCIQCNTKKGDKTLHEANMKLLRHPRTITRGDKITFEILSKTTPTEWKPYIRVTE